MSRCLPMRLAPTNDRQDVRPPERPPAAMPLLRQPLRDPLPRRDVRAPRTRYNKLSHVRSEFQARPHYQALWGVRRFPQSIPPRPTGALPEPQPVPGPRFLVTVSTATPSLADLELLPVR